MYTVVSSKQFQLSQQTGHIVPGESQSGRIKEVISNSLAWIENVTFCRLTNSFGWKEFRGCTRSHRFSDGELVKYWLFGRSKSTSNHNIQAFQTRWLICPYPQMKMFSVRWLVSHETALRFIWRDWVLLFLQGNFTPDNVHCCGEMRQVVTLGWRQEVKLVVSCRRGTEQTSGMCI
jgi:hypothetical protein